MDLLAEDETVKSVGILMMTKLMDKIAAKLTNESVAFLTNNWETGQPKNRGCAVVEKLKLLQGSLTCAFPVVQSLQSRSDAEDRGLQIELNQ